MRLVHKKYNPNKEFIDTFGSAYRRRTESAYNNGDCVVRAFTKLTGLDYMTMASNTAIANGYRDVRKVTTGNYFSKLYKEVLRPMGIVTVNIHSRMNLRNTVVAAATDTLGYSVAFNTAIGERVTSLADRYVVWVVTGHMAATKGNVLYDSWDCGGRMLKGEAFTFSDSALNKKFDWS